MKVINHISDVLEDIHPSPSVWGVIVCFYPDSSLLIDLVSRLTGQVSTIFILNNGGIDSILRKELSIFNNILIHDFGENKGIAAALNEGFSKSLDGGASFVVTFDQDSCPELDHVTRLINHWSNLSSQADVTRKVGAIGPTFYDVRKNYFEYPFYQASGFKVVKQYSSIGQNIVEADALITSGMLVSVEMWRNGLNFDENLFIDFVDTEWCFRSGSCGYIHYGCFDVKMKHELSDTSPVIFLGLMILKYSPIRRYYHFRNCLYLISRYYVPYAFRIRLVGGLFLRLFAAPFVDENPNSSIKSIASGVYDFIRGRYGRKID